MNSVIKNKIDSFLEQNELKLGQLFEVSIAENKGKKTCFVSKNYEITTKIPFLPANENDINFILNGKNIINKVNFVNNNLLLLLFDEIIDEHIDDSNLSGLRIQKGGLFYTIMFYDTPSKSGVLLRELDNKIIMVVNFPKDGKVTWNEKGEFNPDSSGINKCREVYRKYLEQRSINATTTSSSYIME